MSNTRITNTNYEICPYFGRAFAATRAIPQQGPCGGNIGQGVWTDRESSLRPCHRRVPNSCTDSTRFPDGLLFNYLPSEWQQADFRPLTFTTQSRMEIKDQCRDAPGCQRGNCVPCYTPCQQWTSGNPRAREMADISVFDTRFI